MKLIWDEEAFELVLRTADEIAEERGEKSSANFVTEVMQSANRLLKHPNYGQREPLLRKSKLPFRRVVIGKQNKLIYYVDGEVIKIVDFWNTRMSPRTLVKRVIEKTN